MAISAEAELLVRGVARGALEERCNTLLTANRPALSRLAATYTATASDRDDLLQEIALALWRALPRFRGECSERTFLFRIAHNRGIAHLAKHRSTTAVSDELIDPEDPRPSVETRLSEAQQGAQLLAAVRRLPIIYRQVIVLTLEGLSYKDVATVLGIEESNVGVRLNRSRQMLRKLLRSQS